MGDISRINFLEKLLDGAQVGWKALGEMAEIYGGLTGKSKSDFGNGNTSIFHTRYNLLEVNANILDYVKISEHECRHKVKYADVLFTGSSEISDESGMSSAVTTAFKGDVYKFVARKPRNL